MSDLQIATNASTPTPPPVGFLAVYPKTDGKWYYQDNSGVEHLLAGMGDMLAVTYDPTAKAADAFAMDNMVEGAATKILTATERTKLAGIAAGADVSQVLSVAGRLGAIMLYSSDITVRWCLVVIAGWAVVQARLT